MGKCPCWVSGKPNFRRTPTPSQGGRHHIVRSIPSTPMTGPGSQLQHRNPMLSDVLLVAVLFVFALATQILVFAPSMAQWGLGEPPPTPLIVLWAAAFAIPLLWRRRFPCTVLVITAAHFGFFW